MIQKMNIHDSRQGILTFFEGKESITGSVIMPANITLSVGDALARVVYFKQVENRCVLLRIEEIKEQRPSGGEWSGVPPTRYKVVFKKHGYDASELKDIVGTSTDNKGVETYTL